MKPHQREILRETLDVDANGKRLSNRNHYRGSRIDFTLSAMVLIGWMYRRTNEDGPDCFYFATRKGAAEIDIDLVGGK